MSPRGFVSETSSSSSSSTSSCDQLSTSSSSSSWTQILASSNSSPSSSTSSNTQSPHSYVPGVVYNSCAPVVGYSSGGGSTNASYWPNSTTQPNGTYANAVAVAALASHPLAHHPNPNYSNYTNYVAAALTNQSYDGHHFGSSYSPSSSSQFYNSGGQSFGDNLPPLFNQPTSTQKQEPRSPAPDDDKTNSTMNNSAAHTSNDSGFVDSPPKPAPNYTIGDIMPPVNVITNHQSSCSSPSPKQNQLNNIIHCITNNIRPTASWN